MGLLPSDSNWIMGLCYNQSTLRFYLSRTKDPLAFIPRCWLCWTHGYFLPLFSWFILNCLSGLILDLAHAFPFCFCIFKSDQSISYIFEYPKTNSITTAVLFNHFGTYLPICISAQGLFNSIAYGLNSSVRRAIAERIEL